MVFEDEGFPVGGGELAFDEGEVEVFVGAVEFVADDGMAEVGEVDADLVFASGAGEGLEEGEGFSGAVEAAEDFEVGLGGGAIGAHGVFDGDLAVVILTQGKVGEVLVPGGVAMDDGEVFFADGAALPDAAKVAGGGIGFGDEDEAAGFAVEAVDEVRGGSLAEVQTDTADEAGVCVAFGGMADEAGGFVDDEEFGILVYGGEKGQGSLFRCSGFYAVWRILLLIAWRLEASEPAGKMPALHVRAGLANCLRFRVVRLTRCVAHYLRCFAWW